MPREFMEKERLGRNIYGELNTWTYKNYWLCITINNDFPLHAFCVFKSPPTSFCRASHLSGLTVLFFFFGKNKEVGLHYFFQPKKNV